MPPGTVRLLASLSPGVRPEVAAQIAAAAAIGEQSPYPRELFPELARRPRAALSAAIANAAEEPPSYSSPAAEAPLPATPELVGVSEQLFPEVRERKALTSRVMRADD